MRSFSRLVIVLALMVSAVSCQPKEPSLSNEAIPKGSVSHVVVIWLYDRTDETAKREIMSAGRKLEKVQGVVTLTGGEVVPSERPMVDSSFDVAFVMTFKDENDLNHYVNDPAHLEIKRNVLDRYAKQVKIYDFVAQ